ncbi:MAG: methyl-accepting chemotaxis protein [Tissierellales bacterium]|nr:methyl-accepting chemotaxis protein [Tissierellales bacterium]
MKIIKQKKQKRVKKGGKSSKMAIRKKIGIGFLVLVLIIGLVGMMSAFSNYSMIQSLKDVQSHVYNKTLNEMTIQLERNMWIMVGISVLGIVAGAIISIIISKSVIKPLRVTVQQLNFVADGDFTNPVSDQLLRTKGDFGALGLALEKMQENMRELLSKIIEASENLTSSSESLASHTDQSARATKTISDAIAQIADSSSQQAQDADRIAEKTNDLAGVINKTAEFMDHAYGISQETIEQSQSGLEIIVELNQKTATNNERAGEVRDVIHQINDFAANAESITTFIDNIASQTNLLALNASIEAARAGEAGRGFAVVADEIRKLAEDSANATKDITELIQNIQTQSQIAVRSMGDMAEANAEQNTAIGETGAIFDKNYQALNNLVSQLDVVKKYSMQVNSSKDEIVSAVEEISAISEETSASTQEASASAQQQLASIEQLETQAHGTEEMAESLMREVERFKI